MTATPSCNSRPVRGSLHHAGARQRCVGCRPSRVGEARDGRSDRNILAAFTDRVGQSDEIVVVGIQWHRQRSRVPHQLPPSGSSDTACVADAQVPGVRLPSSG